MITDACDANPRIALVEIRQNGQCESSYKLIRTWTATDACGNTATVSQVLSIGDTEGPIFTDFPANVTVDCGGAIPPRFMLHATDACDPNPTVTVVDARHLGIETRAFDHLRPWLALQHMIVDGQEHGVAGLVVTVLPQICMLENHPRVLGQRGLGG